MSCRSAFASCLLAVLMLIQPLHAALRECCCTQNAISVTTPVTVKKAVSKKGTAKCPRCRALLEASHRADESSSDHIRKSCRCQKELKSIPLISRRSEVRVLFEKSPTAVRDIFLQFSATNSFLRELPLEPVRGCISGRAIRLLHCSWLA